MGTIRQYLPDESPYAEIGGRRASARDFGAGVDFGGLAQETRQAASTLLQAQQAGEVSDVHVQLSNARAKWTKELLDQSQTDAVNDPDFAEKFTEKMNNDLAAIGSGSGTVAGQRAAQQGVADMVADFTGRAGVFQAQAAGVKAKNDYQTYLNNGQTTLFYDPSQFDVVLKDAQAALDNPAGPYARLPASAREQLARTGATSLAKSAMQGLINIDPVAAQNELRAGVSPVVKALDADGLTALTAQAKQAIDARLIEADRVQAAQDRANARNDRKIMNDVITKLGEDPTGLSAKDVLNLPFVNPDMRVAALRMVQTGITGHEVTDQEDAIYNDYYKRIHAPDGDPDKITDPALLYPLVDTLGFAKTQQLVAEVGRDGDNKLETQLTKSLDDLAEKSLVVKDPITGFLDPNDKEGNKLLYQFRAWFANEYQKQRDAGKTPQELLSPDSPTYLGRMIDVLAKQRKGVPGLNLKDLLAPDAATPGTAIDLSKASQTATLKDGSKAYLVDGKWVDANGNELK